MTTGFQQQSAQSTSFTIPKHAAQPQQVGQKIEAPGEPHLRAPKEPRTFKKRGA